jgi:hypothetical protein
MRAMLDESRDRLDAGGPRELLELRQLVVRVHALCKDGDHEPTLGLEARRRIGLSDRHWRSL